MKEMMTLTFALDSDYFTTVRLATGGVCSLVGLNLDDSEDCKVCVTESILLLMRSGYQHARLQFCEEDGLCVRLHGEGQEGKATPSTEDEIAIALLDALVSGLSMNRDERGVHGVQFRFGR